MTTFELDYTHFYSRIMPHYVKKLWEKFLLPFTLLFRRDRFLGIQKLFGALARCGERRTKALNRTEKSSFSFLIL